MKQLNVLRPSIEPRASGHIIEQIELVKTILDAGYAYISNGSVYFDVEKYDRVHTYGVLSGRIIDDMMAGSRELDGQDDKRSPNDFALWKKAPPEHIMRWPSPWSVGFPGWHLECSAMSEKYLGEEFDIHGGGMDLIFPHHECELAQNVASRGKGGVNYWVHNNLITINGCLLYTSCQTLRLCICCCMLSRFVHAARGGCCTSGRDCSSADRG